VNTEISDVTASAIKTFVIFLEVSTNSVDHFERKFLQNYAAKPVKFNVFD